MPRRRTLPPLRIDGRRRQRDCAAGRITKAILTSSMAGAATAPGGTAAASAGAASTTPTEAATTTPAEVAATAGSRCRELRCGPVLLRGLEPHLWLRLKPLNLGRPVCLRR